MPELQTLDCLQPGLGKLERVKYFNRMLLTAEDMRTDQDFVLQKLRRHNRFLHGWGVVCGLTVTAAPTAALPWRVQVGAGYALGPFGDEIFVGDAVFMDLATCGPGSITNPCEPSLLVATAPAAAPEIYVGIKYAECRARPVLAMPAGCGCEDDACEYSRIRDSFSLECLADLPASHIPDPDAPTLCEIASGKRLLTCIPCPTEPWVVLAKVVLPLARNAALADAAIDNKPPIRRIVFSTALIQQQVIACCCGEGGHEPPPPPREATIKIEKFGPREPSRGRERDTISFKLLVTNTGTVAAEQVRVEDRLDDITALPDFRIENISADAGAAWVDSDPPDLVAVVAHLDPGQSVSLALEVSYLFRRLRENTRLRNRVTLTSQTPLSGGSVLQAETTTDIHVG
jgi:hypothetical protein